MGGKRVGPPKRVRALVFLWYFPILIVVAMGVLVSLDTSTTSGIVDRARSFQDDRDTAKQYEVLGSARYDLRVNLDETFKLAGSGLNARGNFRLGQKLEILYTLRGREDYVISDLRMEVRGEGKTALIKGFKARVRACASPWETMGLVHACRSGSSVMAGGIELSDDTFPIGDTSENITGSDTLYLLLQIEPAEDLILPVKGYSTPLQIELTGIAGKAS